MFLLFFGYIPKHKPNTLVRTSKHLVEEYQNIQGIVIKQDNEKGQTLC
jgi:hypothetical protein